MKGVVAIVICAAGLSACASPQQVAANHDAYCQSIGAQKGTGAYADCRLAVRAQDEQARANRSRALLAGAAIAAASQPAPVVAPIPRPVNCQTTYWNGTANTQCF